MLLSYMFKENDNYILGPKFQKGLKSVVTESDRDSVANGQSRAVEKNVAYFQIRTGLNFTGQTPCTEMVSQLNYEVSKSNCFYNGEEI